MPSEVVLHNIKMFVNLLLVRRKIIRRLEFGIIICRDDTRGMVSISDCNKYGLKALNHITGRFRSEGAFCSEFPGL